jgi:hypothetical protein
MRIAILTHCPDSLITRKEGIEVSQKVSEKSKSAFMV